MSRRLLFLGALPALVATTLTIHAADRPFGVAGVGNLSCGQYLHRTADDPSARSTYGWWLAGFITGENASKGRRDATDVDAMQVWVDDYCRAHAFDMFVMAAFKLDEELDRKAGKKH